jgi:hypothetical protein
MESPRQPNLFPPPRDTLGIPPVLAPNTQPKAVMTRHQAMAQMMTKITSDLHKSHYQCQVFASWSIFEVTHPLLAVTGQDK